MKSLAKNLSVFLITIILTGCVGFEAPPMATPAQMAAVVPPPIEDNSGNFMSPYTSDGVLAEWVDKSVNAKMGEQLGGVIGAAAGRELAENIPFIGGWLGQAAGEAIGREVALEAAGGEEFIRDTSDISFNSLADLSVYLYVTYSSNQHYADALEAAMSIYPELREGYYNYLIGASQSVLTPAY